MRNYQRNSELLKLMDEEVVGHQEAKKALISLVNRSKWRHYQKFGLGVHKDFLLSPSKVLLIGASGTGKTHLVDTLQKIVHFPLIKIDATKLNPTGASGGIKEEKLRDMIIEEAKRLALCNNYASAEYNSIEGTVDQMVIFVDEIDKLGKPFDSSGNWNAHVQSNFLTLFDNKDEFSGISFIFAGAFAEITKPQAEKKQLGFTNTIDTKHTKDIEDEILKSGLIPELVGRLTHIVELDAFTEQNYFDILNDKIFNRKAMDLAAMGVLDIKIDEVFARKTAKEAIKSGMGVRYLHRALEKLFLDLEFNFEDEHINFPSLDFFQDEFVDHIKEEDKE